MSIDTNINNYSIEDLLVIIGLDEGNNKLAITKRTDSIIGTYESKGNNQLVNFFKKVKEKLISSLGNDKKEKDKQEDILTQQFEAQDNKTQQSKITDRQQQITTFVGQGHFGGPVQERLRLGVSNSVPLKLGQDYINQTLRQEVTKLIVMDSQYRRNLIPFYKDPNSKTSSTSFTVDLNDQIKSCLSLELYSIFIPTTWYVFDDYLNNNYLEIDAMDSTTGVSITGDTNPYHLSIESGNYTYETIRNQINKKLQDGHNGIPHISFDYTDPAFDTTGQSSKSKFFFNNKTITQYKYTIKFYPIRSTVNTKNNKYIQSLGYMMGFRIHDETKPDILEFTIINNVSGDNIVASTTIDLIGPKYFRLILDEFNSNRTNNYEIGLEKGQTKLSLPSYAGKVRTNSASLNAPIVNPLEKYDISSHHFSDLSDVYIPTYPRILTNKQLYALNQVVRNSKVYDDTIRSPNDSNLFAVIPRPNQNTNNTTNSGGGTNYLNLSEALSSTREYFGPIDIKKFKVILEDERGNTLNLHGHDWSFILKAKALYQY